LAALQKQFLEGHRCSYW